MKIENRVMTVVDRILFITLLILLVTSSITGADQTNEDDVEGGDTKVELTKALGVSYDGRSVVVHGARELLFSGSIHYPRSTPDVCINSFISTIVAKMGLGRNIIFAFYICIFCQFSFSQKKTFYQIEP